MNHTGDKIKVIHIITRFDKGGSAENAFLTICGLDKERYQVTLVTGALIKENNNDLENFAIAVNIADVQANGVRWFSVRHLVRELNPLSDMAAFFSLCGIIRREKPDIVHTHTSKAGFLGRWAAWLYRVPIIVHTPHGHVFWGYFKPLKTRLFIMLERLTARITDAMIMLTPQEMKDHLALRIAPEEKFTIIHSGVDLNKFNPEKSPNLVIPAKEGSEKTAKRLDYNGNDNIERMRKNSRLPDEGGELPEVAENKVVIGTVGRLTAIKGQDVLIGAVSELKQAGEDVFLVLLGEGERRGDLEEMARRLEVSGSICLLGWRPDVATVMASFDIFCLPSLNEGMGKVIVEAMAMGLPIVASDVGGIKDLVRNGENGLLVPPGDAAALKEALWSLCRDPEKRRRMGAAGRQTAPLYSAGEMIQQIDRLYGRLLNNHVSFSA
jgi:glycosyltransferase involved in cell wall biosynthesis